MSLIYGLITNAKAFPRSAVTESPLERRLCLRTPGTAIAVVNDNKIPPEGGTPNAFIVKLTRDYKDKALGVPALAGILRATKSKIPAAECVGNGGVPLKSCGLWPPKSMYRNFKVESSLRSPSAKANLFLAFQLR